METYTLTIGDIKRELPIVAVSDELSIASFVILGDTELVSYTAPILASKLPEVDVLVTAEAKGIPLIYELSKQLGMKQYVVARKSIKPYMESPLVNEVESITTQKKQILCLDSDDVQQIKGKRVAIIDDVISTGQSVRGLEELVVQAGGIVAAKAAILAEGNAAGREDIIYLEKLPLFRNKLSK
ncbi:adenine phosphoribosyltransferase [Siminovitchia terrae]|uniref:Adenine phosphoribosyltransferase n=1 Tax=Siminovitchia terrae TaxID=1914933 RepID=A0A429X2F0_SIMTE|nr:phosphoribosyltransferase family protein [Siminovitchia terrae]RST57310.1 adenine phosphoribosyltransferase [Siminovitchia terrae]GIN89755.1 adenine phosphoribosyltransferase [Siminovitchia terrae]GIN97950.1 adenine phosphoribosyltransferase [Siminovitchia terrae]